MRTLFLFCGPHCDRVIRVRSGPAAARGLRAARVVASSLQVRQGGRRPGLWKAIGTGPRITIVGRAVEGQTLPSNVSPLPISDRPGYGTAIVNGHRSIIQLSNNRIVQVMD